MAEGPEPAVLPGMIVFCENKMCNVENVSNTLGFNIYHLVDVYTGERMQKPRHELEFSGISLADENNEEDIVEHILEMERNTVEEPKPKKKRFADITENELDNIALNRNSKNTRNQTMWGVAIFKGETLIVKKFKNGALLDRKIVSL